VFLLWNVIGEWKGDHTEEKNPGKGGEVSATGGGVNVHPLSVASGVTDAKRYDTRVSSQSR
jgi:hypothetical protein